jgi:Flp pilus assembly protein TadB
MTWVAGVLAGAAVLVAWGPGPGLAAARLRGLGAVAGGDRIRGPGPSARGVVATAVSRVPSHRLAAGLAALAVAVVLDGAVGVVAGVGAGLVLDRWLPGLEPRSVRVRRERITADIPVAADLLAACLLAGSPPVDAVDAVSDAVGGPLGDELRRVVALLRLGGDPVRSWLALESEPALAGMGRSFARAAEGGTTLADAVVRVADEQRAARRYAASAAARRVGVWATAPLGLCFLPAFILVGVVPVVAGLAGSLFVP